MEVDSRKPKEWVGITYEPNYKFATTHVHVLLLKGHAHPPYLLCLTLILLCFTLPYLVYFALPLPHFVLPYPALLYLPCPTFGHACLAFACVS
jgi:hypothetical protein